jgi:TonB family protein
MAILWPVVLVCRSGLAKVTAQEAVLRPTFGRHDDPHLICAGLFDAMPQLFFFSMLRGKRNRQQLISLIVLFGLVSSPLQVLASVWASAPKPKFPATALRRGSEGYVIVRAYIGQDGSVTRATISKSSGDSTLDDAARNAVLKWKMSRAAIKPEYLTKGFEQRIDFRQEAPVAARYRDRSAAFDTFQGAKRWAFAPFPEYPFHERLLRIEGEVLVRVVIAADGRVASAEIARSSGNANLDKAAISAVRRWRAHKEDAGQRGIFPIRFSMRRI